MSIDDKILNPQKAIKDFVENHENPEVKRNAQTISQMAAELDGTIKDQTTLKEFKRAVDEFLNPVEKKAVGGLAGRLAKRGYGRSR